VQFHSHQLDNGLQIIGETSPSARSVAVGFFVRTGSRDETPEVSGVSHFLEHMVFKGTPRRTALDVNSDFDRIGANYNAGTSEETTVYYASVLPEYVPQAVDILTDILRPSLREDDFEMEKKVIIEEIGMYDDQPMWLAYDLAKQYYFAAHPLANSILGTPDSVGNLKRDQMYAYFQQRYVPDNITAVAAGNFDWNAFVSLVQTHCGAWEKGVARRQGVRESPGSGNFVVKTKPSVNQEHVVVMSPGPPVKSLQCYAAHTLSVILGDDSGSRLYWALVDRGLADSADTSFHEYDGTGAFYTMFSCDKERAQKNLNLVQSVLNQLQQEGVSEEELLQAKNKVLARLVRMSERPMGRMNALGHNWIYLKTYRSLDDELRNFEAVTLRKIQQVLERYPVNSVTTLALGPLAKLKRPVGNGKK
jgi:predicted Zn-dependent peptidase